MEITGILAQKNKERVNILIDGKYAFSLSLEALLRNRLKKGQTLTSDQIQKFIREDDFVIWYNRALSYISIRPRSVKEMTDFLKKHKAGEQTSVLVLHKLEEKKFLDDREFTSWFISQRDTFRPKGRRLLELELKQKGIHSEIIQEVLENRPTNDEITQAKALVNKKLTQWIRLPEEKRRIKIQGFLARRGFSWDTIHTVEQSITEK